jgi:CO/xanthine dehydrogenase FAD-binding subunit
MRPPLSACRSRSTTGGSGGPGSRSPASGNIQATEAEQALAGAELDDEAIRGAAELAAQAANPQDDLRGTAEYKRQVVRVFTERALRASATSARA